MTTTSPALPLAPADLRRLAWHFVQKSRVPRQDRPDVVSDAVTFAISTARNYDRERGAPSKWVYWAARHAGGRYWAKRRRQPSTDSAALQHGVPGAREADRPDSDLLEALSAAMTTLSEQDAALLRRHFGLGVRPGALCRGLGITSRGARMRLAEIVCKLRTTMIIHARRSSGSSQAPSIVPNSKGSRMQATLAPAPQPFVPDREPRDLVLTEAAQRIIDPLGAFAALEPMPLAEAIELREHLRRCHAAGRILTV